MTEFKSKWLDPEQTPAPITTPQAQRVDHHVKRLGPDPLRWLHLARNYQNDEQMVTGLAVTDGEIELVVLTRRSWNLLSEALNAPHRDRYRALYEDRNGIEKGVDHGDSD